MPWQHSGDSRAIEALPRVEALRGCTSICREKCAQPVTLEGGTHCVRSWVTPRSPSRSSACSWRWHGYRCRDSGLPGSGLLTTYLTDLL